MPRPPVHSVTRTKYNNTGEGAGDCGRVGNYSKHRRCHPKCHYSLDTHPREGGSMRLGKAGPKEGC